MQDDNMNVFFKLPEARRPLEDILKDPRRDPEEEFVVIS